MQKPEQQMLRLDAPHPQPVRPATGDQVGEAGDPVGDGPLLVELDLDGHELTGELVDSASGATYDVVNPAIGEAYADVNDGDHGRLAEAVSAGRVQATTGV